jgi:hypothetical protein
MAIHIVRISEAVMADYAALIRPALAGAKSIAAVVDLASAMIELAAGWPIDDAIFQRPGC